MNSYFRKNIDQMEGYVPGLQPRTGGFIKLNTNENPYPPHQVVISAIKDALGENLRLYPDPLSNILRDKIASVYGVPESWVIAGNGSDDVLNLIGRAVLGKNDRLFITDPTYVLYEVLAKFQEAKIIRCALDENFDLPEKMDVSEAELVMISNPNTPAGTLFKKTKIEAICKKTKGLVLIDEAYADFAETNCLDLVKKYQNVMITRSLSKSFSLAGLRVGFAIARPRVIETMMKVKDSYNLNRLNQAAGVAALSNLSSMRDAVTRIIRDREFLTQKLQELGFFVLPSQANFIFTRHPRYSALRLYEELLSEKILVRHFNVPRLKEYLRISIGTHQDMVKLVKVVAERFEGLIPKELS